MLGKFARVLVALAVTALIGGTIVAAPDRAEALSGSQFDPGYIISDANFYNGNAMSEAEVQSFLTAASGTCQNSNCLAVHRVTTTTTSAGFGPCATYEGAADESAARIIFKVQKACGISAKVLLVTLQKEQGLVTKSAPTSLELRKAMGQGCPDTSDCDANYYGLQKQLYYGSRQLTWYGNPGGSFTYIKVGQSNRIQYHPNSACGAGAVTVKNRATAALYYYTPYQPNAAALANLGGIGDSCSSYGNRNFWVYYNNWFGLPTSGGGNPIGNVDVREVVAGGVRVAGWALDPDTADPIDVHVYVDGAGTRTIANLERRDVGATYPGFGASHGFDLTLPITASGKHQVCVYGINTGVGSNVLLSCADVTIPLNGDKGRAPFGSIDVIKAVAGGVEVRGWAIDPDSAAPIKVHVYVDTAGAEYSANKSRPDVGAAFPGFGDNHGFSETIAAASGSHRVCVYGINSGAGVHTLMGCTTVTVPAPDKGRAPFGSIDVIKAVAGGVEVRGWAIDPDSAAPIKVHVYVDAAGAEYSADKSRPDVGAAFPGFGDNHGFSETIAAASGSHRVCVYGINSGAGVHTLMGCTTVTVPAPDKGRAPFGSIDVIKAVAGGVEVRGWAIDPDSAAPIKVHVYVDAAGAEYSADKSRPDVGAAFPGFGDNHGFSETIAAASGSHRVCVYGINSGAGVHTLMGCTTVTVPL